MRVCATECVRARGVEGEILVQREAVLEELDSPTRIPASIGDLPQADESTGPVSVGRSFRQYLFVGLLGCREVIKPKSQLRPEDVERMVCRRFSPCCEVVLGNIQAPSELAQELKRGNAVA